MQELHAAFLEDLKGTNSKKQKKKKNNNNQRKFNVVEVEYGVY